MTWLHFALVTALLYGFFDFFIKQTAGKVEDGIAALVVNLVATLVLVIYVVYIKSTGVQLFSSQEGIRNAVIAGVLIGLASITFVKMFSSGGNLGLGVVLVRSGMILVGVLLGSLLLKEPITAKKVVGVFVTLAGLGLVLS